MTYKSFNGVELSSQFLRREIMAYPSYEDANRNILWFCKSREVIAKKIIYDPITKRMVI